MTGEKRTIERDCMECGETIEITVHEDGTYDGGEYFGEFALAKAGAEGEYEKTGEIDGFDVVEWTGQKESYEYWECNEC